MNKFRKINLIIIFLVKESNENEVKFQDLRKLNAEINVLQNSIKNAELEIFFNTNKLTSF